VVAEFRLPEARPAEVLDPVPEVFQSLAETPGQVLVVRLAVCYLVPVEVLDRVPEVFPLARSDESPLVAESKSAAKSQEAKRSVARSHRNRVVMGARDALEDVANLDLADQEMAEADAQDAQELAANLDQAAQECQEVCCQGQQGLLVKCYQGASPEEPDDRCSTISRRVSMPLSYPISGVLG
jgi:hypothetical protein